MKSSKFFINVGLTFGVALGPVSTLHAVTVLNLGSGPQSVNRNAAVGMNLGRPDSWTPTIPFIDAAMTARKWIAHNCDNTVWDNGTPISTDSEGWVTNVNAGTCPGMVMLDEEEGTVTHYMPLGTYVLIWEGEGELKANVLPAPNFTCRTAGCQPVDSRTVRSVGAGPHKATFNLTDSNITLTDLRIQAFNRLNPVRRIKALMPGGLIATGNQIDYKSYCRTARGPTGPSPTRAITTLAANQSCRDFETIYWDRHRDELSLIQRYTDVSSVTQAPKAAFHPLELKNLDSWRFLRAMDWMHTNFSTISDWSQRTNYRHQNQTESAHGVALEYLLTLANVLGSDLYVNIPHMANDNYVTQLATFTRDNLHPNLKVYVEYSNEVWNGAFAQGSWVQARGLAKYPGINAFEARLRYQSETAVRFADLFNATYGSARNRVVNVMAGQAANSFVGGFLLDWQNATPHFNAYAIGPYFGTEIGFRANDPIQPSSTLTSLFTEINVNALPTARSWVTNNTQMASSRGIRVIAYESGQHLAAGAPYVPLFTSANRNYRMGDATLAYLNAFRGSAMQEAAYFQDASVFRRFGAWGAREALTQSTTPKLDALRKFGVSNPCWWSGCVRL